MVVRFCRCLQALICICRPRVIVFEDIFVQTFERLLEEKSCTFRNTFSGHLGGCRLNRKYETLKNNCVEHFITMFAATQQPQRRSNSS